MSKIRRTVVFVAALAALAMVAEAGAADFTPKISFGLSDTASRGNPAVNVKVEQDAGEEELTSVEIKVPAGFTLAIDKDLANNEKLGSGQIVISAGPGCAGAIGSAPATVPVDIIEKDVTSAEANDGVKAVYYVDIRSVTQIRLLVRGTTGSGWTLTGTIPANQATCPPLAFDASFFKTSMDTKVPIFTNPQYGGDYRFEAVFKGAQGTISTTSQTVNIQGAAASGKTKKCKKAKSSSKPKKKCRKKKKK